MAESFTPKAESAIAQAKVEASEPQRAPVALCDLLVGLSRVDCLASKVLSTFSLTRENFKNFENMTNSHCFELAPASVTPASEFSPDIERIFSIGRNICSLLGHVYIGTEHLLLAILLDDVGATLINNLGADPERVGNYVLRLTGHLEIDYAELRIKFETRS